MTFIQPPIKKEKRLYSAVGKKDIFARTHILAENKKEAVELWKRAVKRVYAGKPQQIKLSTPIQISEIGYIEKGKMHYKGGALKGF